MCAVHVCVCVCDRNFSIIINYVLADWKSHKITKHVVVSIVKFVVATWCMKNKLKLGALAGVKFEKNHGHERHNKLNERKERSALLNAPPVSLSTQATQYVKLIFFIAFIDLAEFQVYLYCAKFHRTVLVTLLV